MRRPAGKTERWGAERELQRSRGAREGGHRGGRGLAASWRSPACRQTRRGAFWGRATPATRSAYLRAGQCQGRGRIALM